MKKFLACACAAALMLGAVQTPHTTAYAITVIDDAQTACEKNMERFLDLLEKADVDVNFTKDDMENLLFGACEYSTNSFVGTGFLVERFKVVSPTATKAGYVSADVSIFIDDGEEALTVKKEIPAGTDSRAFGGLTTDDGDSEPVKEDVSDGKIDEATAKKYINAAKKAISDAMWTFEVSNDTTSTDILKMAMDAADNNDVIITLDKANFKIVKSSSTVNGTVSATLTLKCGTVEDAVPAAKTLPLIVNETTKAIDEDRHLIGVAMDEIAYDNRTTKKEMLEVAEKAVKNGTKVSWKSFNKINATFKEDGNITAYLTMTLGDEERETRFSETLPKLVRKLPVDKTLINKEEWEILRLTNIERNKVGSVLLTMPEVLQNACSIREVELVESFSHTRPNGQKPFTAITGLSYSTAGENIYKCDAKARAVSGENAMNSWMNSDGHRANLLKSGYNYMGVGVYDAEETGTAVQLFAGVPTWITSVVTASGKTNYIDTDEMQKDYLICTASDGMVSYVPIDLEYMTKTESGYTLNLRMSDSADRIYLTTGDSANWVKPAKNTEEETKTEENKTENTNTSNVTAFADVKSADYFADAVKWAVERNITQGTSATTFSPNDTCTRAQILTFLWRAVGSPKAEIENPFADVSSGDYFYDAAIWAYGKDMVSGSKFDGNTPCTRSSTVEYLWKNANSPRTEISGTFSDVSNGAGFAEAVAWAVKNNVTAGTSATTFSPDDTCTRGQIVTFLNRAIQ